MKLRIRKEVWILFCVLVMCEAGCASDNTQEQDILQNATEQVSNADTERENDTPDFFGTYRIEKVAVISDMYTGSTLDGVAREDVYDPEDFIGCEIAYNEQYFRLGEKEYDNPQYKISEVTIEELDEGGMFRPKTVADFLEEEDITLEGGEQYSSTAEVPLRQFTVNFQDEVTFGRYGFIPMGTRCTVLNSDVILVGTWGKIMVAYRVDEDVSHDCVGNVLQQEQPDADDSDTAFQEFLEGNRLAYFGDIGFGVETLRENAVRNESELSYGFCDRDGDGTEELIMKTSRHYYIFQYEYGQVHLWHMTASGTTLLRDGAFLFVYLGDDPQHTEYQYYTLDQDGQENMCITFSHYDNNGNGTYEEEDTFYFENEEVTRETWTELTAPYLNSEGGIREDIQAQIEWTVIADGNKT